MWKVEGYDSTLSVFHLKQQIHCSSCLPNMSLSHSEPPISLCIFFETRIYYTAQTGLEPLILVPLPSEYWNYKHELPHPGQHSLSSNGPWETLLVQRPFARRPAFFRAMGNRNVLCVLISSQTTKRIRSRGLMLNPFCKAFCSEAAIWIPLPWGLNLSHILHNYPPKDFLKPSTVKQAAQAGLELWALLPQLPESRPGLVFYCKS